MVDFTATVTDPHLRARLEVALDGRGAFGRFSRVIDADDEWLGRWLARREAGRLGRARAWLADQGYRPAD